MKKATMNAIVNYLTDNLSYADESEKELLQTMIAELNAELNKDAELKAENAKAYEAVKPLVLEALTGAEATIGELYEAVKGKLPEGFTKGKLQYAVTQLWKGELVRHEGKVNSYSVKE